MQATSNGTAKPTLKILPQRLHHHAYTTDDHEKTRQFYEDVIGLPLVAAYIENEHLDGEWVELAHAFYGIGDGGALAFFNFADPEKQQLWRAKDQPLFVHLALKVEQSTQDEIKERLEAAGLENFSINHGYCDSLYVRDPNNFIVEFTVDPENVDEISASMAKTAHDDLRRWVAGDREVNNTWRPVVETEVKAT